MPIGMLRYMWHSQAEEIAEKLCESVAASLEGKKLASFTRISSTVQVYKLSIIIMWTLNFSFLLVFLPFDFL